MLATVKSTRLWKVLRGVKRTLKRPGDVRRCAGRVEVGGAPVAVEAGQAFAVRLTVTNSGGDGWAAGGPAAVGLTARFLTRRSEPFGEPARVPLPHDIYPGEPAGFAVTLAAPAVVGDFTLEVALDKEGEAAPDRAAVTVVGPRGTDIDYHAVYRTADLEQNHWWVVGGYDSREHYERSTRERHQMLTEHAGLTPDSRVLDIGCGTGQVGDALKETLSERGKYYGTDIGREAVEFCRRRFARPNFRFAQGTMTEVPFETADGPFDIAIFFSVFTHTFLDESVLLLAETRRLLAAGGVVVADIITSDLVERASGHRGEMVVNAGHFLKLAAALGFEAAVIGRWPWKSHAERLMLTLRQRGEDSAGPAS